MENKKYIDVEKMDRLLFNIALLKLFRMFASDGDQILHTLEGEIILTQREKSILRDAVYNSKFGNLEHDLTEVLENIEFRKEEN